MSFFADHILQLAANYLNHWDRAALIATNKGLSKSVDITEDSVIWTVEENPSEFEETCIIVDELDARNPLPSSTFFYFRTLEMRVELQRECVRVGKLLFKKKDKAGIQRDKGVYVATRSKKLRNGKRRKMGFV